MFGSGRTLGIVFIIAGTLVACGGIAMSVATKYQEPTDDAMPMAAIPLLFGLPVAGWGLMSFRRGRQTLQELDTIQKQKKILRMISHHGWVKISDLVHELQSNTDEIQYLIYDLVKRGLFHGYIDWRGDQLHSKHEVVLQGATHCPSCGGAQIFSGKGVIPCQHCNVQVLL